MNLDEDDLPPLLVNAKARDNDFNEDQTQIKVPITIVTGQPCAMFKLDLDILILSIYRIPWCWENHSYELYLK